MAPQENLHFTMSVATASGVGGPNRRGAHGLGAGGLLRRRFFATPPQRAPTDGPAASGDYKHDCASQPARTNGYGHEMIMAMTMMAMIMENW